MGLSAVYKALSGSRPRVRRSYAFYAGVVTESLVISEGADIRFFEENRGIRRARKT